jgi:thiamine transport system substrate-binding protein
MWKQGVLACALWISSAYGKSPELVLYTYDSFVARGGLGPLILPSFEKKYGCRVKAIATGGEGQLLSRLQLDARRGKSVAHLVLGINRHLWELSKPWVESWGDWVPQGYSELLPQVKVEKGFLPYDYGVLALMVDRQLLRSRAGGVPPRSLQELLKPEWKRNLILEDPRTSAPGLSFFLYTRAVLGDSVWDYWKKLRSQWLTLTPGWEGAYGLFLRKEAPLVWSYLTSQAYHDEQQGQLQTRYQAQLFDEGQPFEVEGVAWVKGAFKSDQEKELAKKFMEYLISPEVQALIPKTVWMLPARKDIDLPMSFKKLPKPSKLISLEVPAKEVESALRKWNQTIGN